jgi:hypothetical protein
VTSDWIPPATRSPEIWQLGLMTATLGLPFFALSASAPMFQHWFAHTDHPDANNPYFLYAASNLGSVTALLCYPVLIEPFFNIITQSTGWMMAFGVLIFLVIFSAILVWGQSNRELSAGDDMDNPTASEITWGHRFTWLILAFVPSSLMLGVTTYMTTDIASVPLLWVMPLALYVGTFIIAFSRKPLIDRDQSYSWQAVFFVVLLGILASGTVFPKLFLVLLHLSVFFFTALMCHHELAKAKPNASQLTQFYLIMSAGGALGGIFNALIAPQVFVLPIEYGLVLILAMGLRYITEDKTLKSVLRLDFELFWNEKRKRQVISGLVVVSTGLLITLPTFFDINSNSFFSLISFFGIMIIAISFSDRKWIFVSLSAVLILAHPPSFSWHAASFDKVYHQSRNFFGVKRVVSIADSNTRSLMHGTTNHGSQILKEEDRLLIRSYYGPGSGLRDIYDYMDNQSTSQEIAVLGLGAGTLACYQKENRHYDFFEIDPAVVRIAKNPEYFTFLSDCGSPYNIYLGDGRLKMREREDEKYNLIILDAFSSDNIPVHIVTLNAMQEYAEKLVDDGMIVSNISNRYLDLRPVLGSIASKMGNEWSAYAKFADGGKKDGYAYHASEYVALTKNQEQKEFLVDKGWQKLSHEEGFRTWTDQFSNILSIIKLVRNFMN